MYPRIYLKVYRDYLAEIWRYRELFYFLVWRDIKVRYKQTIMGASWAVIQPLLTMVVFTLLFGKLARMPSDGVAYPVFSYSALVPWIYFSSAIGMAGNGLVANSNLISKVYFPRIALCAAPVLAGVVDFLIASTVLIPLMLYFQVYPDWEIIFWPMLIIPLIMLAMGTGMFLASLNVKYRDIKFTIPFVTQLWMFSTPIIYPISKVPQEYHLLLSLNPTTGIIEAFRASLLPTVSINWELFAFSFMTSMAIFILGLLYFHKTEKYFADII